MPSVSEWKRFRNVPRLISVRRWIICSWHNAANVMYVDQPVGTGLSFTTKANYADDDLEVCVYLSLSRLLQASAPGAATPPLQPCEEPPRPAAPCRVWMESNLAETSSCLGFLGPLFVVFFLDSRGCCRRSKCGLEGEVDL